jgi:hypothetical protein
VKRAAVLKPMASFGGPVEDPVAEFLKEQEEDMARAMRQAHLTRLEIIKEWLPHVRSMSPDRNS